MVNEMSLFKSSNSSETPPQAPLVSFIDNIKSEVVATFSSDDDEEQSDEFRETQSVKCSSQAQAQTNLLPIQQATSMSTKSPSPSVTFLQLQNQLNQFLVAGGALPNRPFKLFASVDDTATNTAYSTTDSNTNLDNHIHLIASDYLRDKLFELNDKIKSNRNKTSGSLMPQAQVNASFKDILTYIHRDVETLNNFSSTLTDLTISLCIILKNDFTNYLLPASFYPTATNNIVSTSNCSQHKSRHQQQNNFSSGGLSKWYFGGVIYVSFSSAY